jgi:hypothetical protein
MILPTTLKRNFLNFLAKSTPLVIDVDTNVFKVFAELIRVFADEIIVLAETIN